MTKTLRTYAAFFDRQKAEIKAASLYEAKELAIAHFNPRRTQRHTVSVLLVEKNGETIPISPASFG